MINLKAAELENEDLEQIVGGAFMNSEVSYTVTCNCGYEKHFTTFKEATKDLFGHVRGNRSHNTSLNVSGNLKR